VYIHVQFKKFNASEKKITAREAFKEFASKWKNLPVEEKEQYEKYALDQKMEHLSKKL
jgi:hypothetical protein